MKKLLIFLLSLLFLFSCVGCVRDLGGDPFGVTASVKDVTPTSLTLVLTQKGGMSDLIYGAPYSIEVYVDGAWETLPYLPSEAERAWIAIAYLLSPNSSSEQKLSWEDLYGPLPKGKYRVCKEVTHSPGAGKSEARMYYAEFEIE